MRGVLLRCGNVPQDDLDGGKGYRLILISRTSAEPPTPSPRGESMPIQINVEIVSACGLVGARNAAGRDAPKTPYDPTIGG